MKSARSTREKSEVFDREEQIRRLGKRRVLEVPKMLDFHTWLDGKRLARRSCRVVGESRTGKYVQPEEQNCSDCWSATYRSRGVLALSRRFISKWIICGSVAVSSLPSH
jgi:hypothetical protein